MTHRPAERITKAKDTWLIRDEPDHSYFNQKRREMIKQMGYNVPDDYCPALIAESIQREAETLIVEVAEKFSPSMTKHKLLCAGLEKYHKYIDLIVGMCVNHPSFIMPKIPKG